MKQSSDKVFRRYLSLLGWVGDPGLFGLVRSHLIKVPFENISGLLALESGPDAGSLEVFVEGIDQRSLGGAYFANNLHFAALLRFLDYDVELLSAKIGGREHAHAILRVDHEGTRCLVDVGYAAPFYEPIPLDSLPYRAPHGEFEFVVDRHPVLPGVFEVATLQGSKKVQTYTFKDEPVAPEVFDDPHRELLGGDSEFLRDLRIVRFFDSRVLAIHGSTLSTTAHGVTTKEPVRTVDDLENSIQELMLLDRCPVRDALRILRERQGVRIL